MSFKIRQYSPDPAPAHINPYEPPVVVNPFVTNPIVVNSSAARDVSNEPITQANVVDKMIQSPFITGMMVANATGSNFNGFLTSFILEMNKAKIRGK